MIANEPVRCALARLERTDLPAADREALTAAFAALPSSEAIALPETMIEMILRLDRRVGDVPE